MSPEVINLVAARLKSSRLPGKALLKICGKPILWHVIDRVERAHIPHKTVICTSVLPSDDLIAEFADKHGLNCYRGHPDNVLRRFIDAAQMHGADHVVRITGDNPLTDPELIDEMCQLHSEKEADYTYTEDTPRGTRPEIISVETLKKCNMLAENPNYSEYMTLYFRNHPQVFENVKYRCRNSDWLRPNYLVTVDTPADFEVVSKIYNCLYWKCKAFSLVDVIKYLDAHPEIDHEGRKKVEINTFRINTRLKI